MSNYTAEYDAITTVMQHYIGGSRAGKSALMHPGFHADATIVGHYPGGTLTGSIQQLYGWIDQNGPAPGIEPRFADVQVIGSIALVRLEVENWTGKLVGPNAVRMSDWFTLLKIDDSWKITHKTFHWHTA